jgi:tetratricopeptide (TPR) repeat protein
MRLVPSLSILGLVGLAGRLAGVFLFVLLVAAAFLLGCQELFDSDVWWHVRAGQWIWASKTVPRLDPFTFASADRAWIDLHWLFQLGLAGAHAAGGVPGMILTTSGACAVVIGIGLASGDRRVPVPVTAACWLPALAAMSARFDPRPEVLSMLFMAAYLAVLPRIDRTPALAWLLPIFQVLWVNTHALFVLGPIILGALLIDRLVAVIRPAANGGVGRLGVHQAGATAAVALACLVNPYGLRGALFPLELFPKITQAGALYKSYVDEFMGLRTFVETLSPDSAVRNFYFRAECLLLGVLPLSFIVPAVWEASRRSVVPTRARGTHAFVWWSALGLAAGLVFVSVPGFSAASAPWWPGQLSPLAPAGFAALGFVGAALLLRAPRAPTAALLATLGGMAQAAWVFWLRAHLFEAQPRFAIGIVAAVAGAVTATVIVSRSKSGRLFRMILTAAFSYLAIQAVRNINLFGLIAGFVLAWNLGEWAVAIECESEQTARAGWRGSVSRLAAWGVLAAVVVFWIVAIISGSFWSATGEQRRLGLREAPLAYAHDAAEFAGRPGLPERAVALDLRQAAVYLFHNGPEHKLFMDGRLEVPSRATFETFVHLGRLLNDGRPGWEQIVRRMGNPLILLDHVEDYGAEATLLANPAWRCVYYDAVASVFVARGEGVPEATFPSVDFAERHFRDPAWRAVPLFPRGLGEAKALLNLGWAVRRRPALASQWRVRFSLMLLASDRLRQAIKANAGTRGSPPPAGLWSLLGTASANMVPDLTVRPHGPEEPWDPARGLLAAQAAHCDRQALESVSTEVGALIGLHDAFKARRMEDAQRSMVALMRRAWPAGSGLETRDTTVVPQRLESADPPAPAADDRQGLERAVVTLLEQGRPEAAVRFFDQAVARSINPPWVACDRAAGALMYLGYPRAARATWTRAVESPARALRLTRIATADLAALDYESALRGYRAALDDDPRLGEALFGLALLHTQLGQGAPALAAARQGMSCRLTEAQKSFLIAIEAFVTPYAAK